VEARRRLEVNDLVPAMSDYYSNYQPYQPQYLGGQATVQPQQMPPFCELNGAR